MHTYPSSSYREKERWARPPAPWRTTTRSISTSGGSWSQCFGLTIKRLTDFQIWGISSLGWNPPWQMFSWLLMKLGSPFNSSSDEKTNRRRGKYRETQGKCPIICQSSDKKCGIAKQSDFIKHSLRQFFLQRITEKWMKSPCTPAENITSDRRVAIRLKYFGISDTSLM